MPGEGRETGEGEGRQDSLEHGSVRDAGDGISLGIYRASIPGPVNSLRIT